MANLTGTPTYSNILRQLETTDPKHPDTWNPNYQKLLNNDTYLKQFADEVEGARFGRTSISQVINEILNSLGNIAGQASAVSVQRAVGLDWLYRNRRIALELFADGYRLNNHAGVSVISGVAGDDSLDVTSTDGIRAGRSYLLKTAGAVPVLINVTNVLSATRLRLATSLTANYGANDTLTGTTLTARSGGGVDAPVGAQYVSKEVNLGEDTQPRAIIIRRSLNAGEVRLFFSDGYTPAWTERPWSLRRSGGVTSGIPEGFADYEYIVPMRGDGYIRLLVDGEAQIIHHVVGMGAATGLGGFVNPLMRPAAPTITAPANAATNVVETPTLTASNYVSPAGNAFATAQFQISASNTFATILHDSGDKQALTYSVPAGVLAVNATFYLRSRFKDVAGLVSDWSAVTSFTTKATYTYVATPLVTSPTNGQLDVTEQPTFQSSAFAVTGGSDTHASSQWQIRLASNTWATVLHDSGASTTAKTSYTVPAGVLLAGQTQYVMRLRHTGTTNGASEWSSDVAFTTKQSFATIMGIVLTATGAGGTWQRVDGNFNAISTTAATFNNHPTYAGVIAQTVDGQAMVKVPKFYVRTGTVPSGTYTGKKYWMISDQSAAGFSVHPAFMNAGAEIAQYWVGKYQGTADGSAKLGSAAGVNPLSGIDITTMKARAEARNVSGVTGFQLWNIYQLSAIQLLALLEMGGSDSQALVGSGNSGALSATDNSVVAQATWRGIVGLWGNIAQAVDGIRTNGANQYEVWDISGNKTWQSTGLATPGGASYIVDTYNTSGANYNMAMLFAPSSSSVAYSNATYPDAFYASAGCIATNGRHYNPAQDHGLFALGFQTTMAATTDGWGQPLGGRLAKV